ncbi:tetratricopeptide repeat protein [Microvirga alba]|uniref:Tetratricopeptide repeat protein n=1 Tax=Microvirga alba TaxID=2791025 RepID=A0A931FPQ0_9HYPH|nr:tetratricopeptide repeat protein [Microvirga alba]MBF9235204.1 tetratricopeptide repeat protein [Microvirga alba]
MPVIRGTIAIAVASLGFAALAQQAGDGGHPAPTLAAATPSTLPPQVDESALRYFASQGDTRRVEAEIARLRALYPNWSPPTDLSQLPAGPITIKDPEVDRLWALYGENKIAEIRAAITERQASDPQWKPPADLLTALDTAEARRRLINASDNAQWRTVLSVATEAPSLLTCTNVDVLWRVAEAFAKTNQQNRTRDAYTYLLTNCTNSAERLGTLQKALTLLPEQQVTDLLRFERKGGSDPDDFSSIRDDLARRRVERASTDNKLTASADDLAVVERLAEGTSEPGNVILLGYYAYHHKNSEKALALFKTALDRDGGAKAAEGYALSLRDLNRFVEAEAFAYEWRDKAPENLKVYLDVATALLSQDPPPRLDPQVVARVVPVVTQQRFVDGAQALGWYSYNTGQFRTAREWFQRALSWKADDEPSAYGAALASQRLNDRVGFNAIVTQWRSRSQRIADVADGINRGRTPPPAQPSTLPSAAMTPAAPAPVVPPRTAYASSQATEPRVIYEERLPRADLGAPPAQPASRSGARRNCAVTRNPSSLSADAALTLGWCLMELNRPLEAVTAFDRAIKGGSDQTREEAAYGKTLAYLRKDLTAEAALAAAESPQTAQRRTELDATILAQRALAAFREGRYVEVILALGERSRIVPEQTDLMVIRGWSYYKLGRYDDAEKIFLAVQRTGYSDDANVGLNAVREAVRPSRQY